MSGDAWGDGNPTDDILPPTNYEVPDARADWWIPDAQAQAYIETLVVSVPPPAYTPPMDYRALLSEAEHSLHRWDVDRELQAWLAARVMNHIDRKIDRLTLSLKEFIMADLAQLLADVDAEFDDLVTQVQDLKALVAAGNEPDPAVQDTIDQIEAKIASVKASVADVAPAPGDTEPAPENPNPPVADTSDGEGPGTVAAVPDASQPDATADAPVNDAPEVGDQTGTVNEGAPGADGDVTGAT